MYGSTPFPLYFNPPTLLGFGVAYTKLDRPFLLHFDPSPLQGCGGAYIATGIFGVQLWHFYVLPDWTFAMVLKWVLIVGFLGSIPTSLYNIYQHYQRYVHLQSKCTPSLVSHTLVSRTSSLVSHVHILLVSRISSLVSHISSLVVYYTHPFHILPSLVLHTSVTGVMYTFPGASQPAWCHAPSLTFDAPI